MPIVIDPKNPTGITWLASYPCSGDAHLRSAIYALVKAMTDQSNTDVDLGEVDGLFRSETTAALYEKYLTRPPHEVDPDEIAAARPMVQDDIVVAADGPILVGTHNAHVSDRSAPLVNHAVSAGAIYLLRNPLDLASSYARWRKLPLDTAIAELATPAFISPPTPTDVYEYLGSWSENVLSWTSSPSRAILVVRLEDLVRDPATILAALAEHLLMKPTPPQLGRALDLADSLRAAAGVPSGAEATGIGAWRHTLSAAQAARIVASQRQQMSRFGYLP